MWLKTVNTVLVPSPTTTCQAGELTYPQTRLAHLASLRGDGYREEGQFRTSMTADPSKLSTFVWYFPLCFAKLSEPSLQPPYYHGRPALNARGGKYMACGDNMG